MSKCTDPHLGLDSGQDHPLLSLRSAHPATGPVPNYADEERWLRAAATQGDAEAQLWLGIAYDREYFGRIDYQESLKWLRKSAAQGLPDAQYALAQMSEEEHGVPKSDEDAAYWYRRAADHFSDVSGAEVQLAYMYRDGSLRRNDLEAYMWFAIVGAAVDPPTDEDVKEVAEEMTPAQIAEARAKVTIWTQHHPPRPRLASTALIISFCNQASPTRKD